MTASAREHDPRAPISNLFLPSERKASVGIGIVTYNRAACVQRSVEHILNRTRHDKYELVVADDGSSDETSSALAPYKDQISYLSCPNGGVNINKNRILYYFNIIKSYDVSIIIEDDSYPTIDGWEERWINAALRYGHVNNAGVWFAASRYAGSGSVDDPYLSKDVSAQCVGFAREAVARVGFFDPEMANHGCAHGEHTYRMARAGYGGIFDGPIEEGPGYFLIDGSIHTTPEETGYKTGDDEGLQLYHRLKGGPLYRHAWRNDQEQERLWRDIGALVEKG